MSEAPTTVYQNEDDFAVAMAEEAAKVKAQEAAQVRPTDQLITRAQALLLLDEEIRVYEDTLKTLKSARDNLKKTEIPELMRTLGMVTPEGKGSFTLADGTRMSLRTDTYVSVKADHKAELLFWLRQTGAESLIKEDVSSASLRGHVRELLEGGQAVPEYVSVYRETTVSTARGKLEK